jgi:[ribosomal protein S5]-alanine N-acetyltransferase
VQVKTIETARLVLRPFRWEDFETFHGLAYADPDVARAWTGRTRALDEVRSSFANKVGQPSGMPGWLAVILKDGDTLIGGIGLQRWEPDEDTSWFIPEHPDDAPKRDPAVIEVELSYVLGRAYWDHGYATEAARAVLAYGFGELGVARILSPIGSENTRSIRLAQRLGCRISRNLHPRPSPFWEAPGVIAVMGRREWFQAAPAEAPPSEAGGPRSIRDPLQT